MYLFWFLVAGKTKVRCSTIHGWCSNFCATAIFFQSQLASKI